MLISFDKLFEKYELKLTGILHVGAHECEELKDYEKYIDRNKILWIEGNPDLVIRNKNTYPNICIENAVVWNEITKLKFHIANNGQSSSVLDFGLHEKYHNHVYYTNEIEVETQILEDILKKYTSCVYNFLNFDIQGADLQALKGMESYLENVNYIYIEVNTGYVYKNNGLLSEVDDYLAMFGFTRVETCLTEFEWGDAFYIKE